ncbi:MAG: lipid-binding SYLF domain-containing protein [Gammaproteobacteria bacterium]|nr:lipid-binding SYLF domain-containing protein [Gammaproteobacteria bacterium]
MRRANSIFTIAGLIVLAAGIAVSASACSRSDNNETQPVPRSDVNETTGNAGDYAAGGYAMGTGPAAGTMNRSADGNQVRHRALELADVKATIATFKQARPGIGRFFDNAYGYAVFPTIGKGGLSIGAAFGGGAVFRQGELVGHATVTNFSIGAQIGGKTFSEVIFFQNAKAFDRFTRGHFQFGTDAISVGVPAGATAEGAVATLESAYSDVGLAVFTMTKAGFMTGVNIGGQRISYTPLEAMQDGY